MSRVVYNLPFHSVHFHCEDERSLETAAAAAAEEKDDDEKESNSDERRE